MTVQQWQDFAAQVNARANRVSTMISDRGRDLAASFGADRDYCFHLASNWIHNSWEPPQYKAAMRKCLWLQQQSYIPGRIAERIINRAYRSVSWN